MELLPERWARACADRHHHPAADGQAVTMTPRGIRNNNPGNIRWGEDWRGLVAPAQRTDPDFCQFVAPVYGIRAIGKILLTYQARGILMLHRILRTWAPA